jgi:hypothetical protein
VFHLLIDHKIVENYTPSRLPSTAGPTCLASKGLTAEADLKHHADS